MTSSESSDDEPITVSRSKASKKRQRLASDSSDQESENEITKPDDGDDKESPSDVDNKDSPSDVDKKDGSSDEDEKDSSSESSDDEPVTKPKGKAAKPSAKKKRKPNRKLVTLVDSDEDEEKPKDDAEEPGSDADVAKSPKGSPSPGKAKGSDDGSSDDSSDDSSAGSDDNEGEEGTEQKADDGDDEDDDDVIPEEDDEVDNSSPTKPGVVYDFDIMMAKKKEENSKKRRRRGYDIINDNDDIINDIINQMRDAVEADIEANKNKQVATNKLKLLPFLINQLRKVDLRDAFLDSDVLSVITEWLAPLPDRSLPHLNIRENLLKILIDFNLYDVDRIKGSGIGKAVMYLYKHPKETKENKLRAKQLISAWSRPIFNLDSSFSAISREEREERDKELQRRASRSMVADGSDDEDNSTATPKRPKDNAAEEPPKNPGDKGWIPRARVPAPSMRDYVIRPRSKVDGDIGKGSKRPSNMLEKLIKTHQERRRANKQQRAVNMKIDKLQAREALKLINDIEESNKEKGLAKVEEILSRKETQIVEYGYDQVILKELIKLTKFEAIKVLKRTIQILLTHYGPIDTNQDEIMETLLFRYGMSTDFEICSECVESIMRLIDMMGDNVAKHSRQIMQAADLNNFISLNGTFISILGSLKQKLPERKTTV